MMTTDQDDVSRILSELSHPLRREILLKLSEKGELSFTDMMNLLEVDTGKLSFHIRSLAEFLEQTPSGKYRLGKLGENAIVFIKDIEAWAVEASVSRKTSILPLASTEKRIYAFLIDFAIALGVFTVTAITTNLLSSITTGGPLLIDFPNLILFLLLFWAYLTLLEGFVGQSLGKRIMGLKVIRLDGKRLSYDHAAVRNFGKAFLLPFDLFFGLMLKDKKFLRYFDKFAGTTVIDLRPPGSSDRVNE
jgi:uncharacterized RDD family membrane protein YckC/DNA-binding transcriptional ArsR family regulator